MDTSCHNTLYYQVVPGSTWQYLVVVAHFLQLYVLQIEKLSRFNHIIFNTSRLVYFYRDNSISKDDENTAQDERAPPPLQGVVTDWVLNIQSH